ncbi:MAG: hypothetical protein Q8R55_04205 [Candidatus Taylorbacteria bacterium]|nr:hypothetical protein [Candidatus Taylorbacteria bacterium]
MSITTAQSTIDWNRGITVQPLMLHHQIPTCVGWVHNLLETEPTNLAIYDFKPKPAGWGNGGGGLEKSIYVPKLGRHLTELENLELLFPNHPILTDNSLTDDQKLIIACGIREFLSETGYREFDIKTDYPGVFLYDYKYRDYVDARGVLHPGGHRKITIWGQINSYRIYENDRIEKHEVDKTEWVDMAEPLPSYFFNPIRFPDRPYWSHVRYSVVCLLRIHGYLKANTDHFIPNIPARIHPSWRYIFKVGGGDSRFPAGGYQPLPREWYKLFGIMVNKRLEEVDNDFIFDLFSESIGKAKRREEEREKPRPELVEATPEETQAVTQVVEDSEDSDGIPTLEEMRQKEDEEYAKWFENN